MTTELTYRKEYADGFLLFDIIDESASIARITINNPNKRNALSRSMWLGLSEIFDDCLTFHSTIRVLIITGRGSLAFSSGADLSEKDNQPELNDGIIPAIRLKIRRYPIPILAEINGFCLGGGLALAMSADIRLASSNATFSIPAVKLGVVCPPDIIYRLIQLVGESQAKMLLYQGSRITGQQALSMGLIQHLSDDSDKLAADVLQMARTLASNAPLSIRAIKTTIEYQYDQNRIENAMEMCFTAEDAEEGRNAFREKRIPHFRGC